jgi:recombination protein RecR
VLRASPEDAMALAAALRDVKEKITLCEICFNLAEGPRCAICLDERRDTSVICVVEEPGDVIPIERTHEYRGRYHVLGGALSPIDGVEPEDLKIAQLFARITGAETDSTHPEVREIILATNPTTTGEATALHLAAGLHERAPAVAVTRLASGLPVGGDLEYADEVTLGRAFSGRRAL